MKPIEVRDVTRLFKTKSEEIWALKGVSFEVHEGEIYGLLGPNGAGKTTMIRILSTLLYPTTGKAYVLGHDVVKEPEKIHPYINSLSGGENSGYGIVTAYDNLWFFGNLYGLPFREIRKRIKILAEAMEITHKLKTKFNKLSTGEKQKINLIRALLNDPRVLFLDEPTLGLDIEASRKIREFIKSWVRETGASVIWTTHYMHEAEEMCDRIGIIKEGKIIASGTVEEIKSAVRKIYKARVKFMDGSRIETKEFYMSDPVELGNHVETLVREGFKILDVDREEVSLEEAFVELVFKNSETDDGQSDDKDQDVSHIPG